MSRLGFNDRCALLIGFSFRKRVVIEMTQIRFQRPSGRQYIDGLVIVDKASDDIENFSLLTAIENLRQARKGDARHFDPGRNLA